MRTRISLAKSRCYAGIPRTMWHYARKPRDVKIDSDTLSTVRKIASKCPTYGTRRMAAQITRETKTPTNRKKIQRIYRKIGWIVPKMSKSDIQNQCGQAVHAIRPKPALADRHHIHPLRRRWMVLLFQRYKIRSTTF